MENNEKEKEYNKDYYSVSIPVQLIKLIDKGLKLENILYKTRADLILDSIRIRLRALNLTP